MAKKTIKEYAKGDLTVLWEPKTCIHAALCVKNLGEVFNPKASPWVNMDGASLDRIRKQVHACPSGALSIKGETASVPSATRVQVRPDGPVLIHGDLIVENADGSQVNKGPVTALCRCGASANKPYCDGAHAKTGFQA